MNPPHISVLKQEVLETFENELIAKNEMWFHLLVLTIVSRAAHYSQ